MVRSEYSAREFNHDPSAISRAARALGRVRITNRGNTSLLVLDAAQYPELAAETAPTSLVDSLAMAATVDDALIGEPPRARIGIRFQDAE